MRPTPQLPHHEMADNFRLYRALVSFQISRVLREKNYASWIAAFLSSLECRFLPRRTRKLSFFLFLFDLPSSFFLFLQRYFQICFHRSTRCLVILICTRKIENSSSLQIPLTLSFELSIRFLVKWRGRSSIHERKEKANLRCTILRILYKSPKNKPSPAFLTNCN